jgi:drug/metabolite transporter (DMT)-like permease
VTRRGLALFTAMSVIWGTPYLLIKVAVEELSPVTLVALRTGIGALLLLPLAVGGGHLRPLLSKWRWVLVFTVVEVAGPWLLLSDAERHLSSSLAGLLIATVPLIGAVMALIVGGDDRLDARRVAGLLIGLGGVAVLLGLDVSSGDVGAVCEIGLVAVGYAAGPLIISHRLSELSSIGVVTAALAVTAAVYAPFAVSQAPANFPSAKVVGAVVGLAVVCTALAFILFFALIAEIGPVRATVITYVNPAVAVILGVVLLHEPFGVSIAAGFALILLGSYFATRRALPGQPAPSEVQPATPVAARGETAHAVGRPVGPAGR